MLTSNTSKQNLWKIPLIAIVDTCLIFLTTGVALLVRFDFSMSKIPREYMEAFLPVVGIMCLATIVVFWFRRMYHYIWRSVNAADVLSMTLSSTLAFCAGCMTANVIGVDFASMEPSASCSCEQADNPIIVNA